MNKATSIETKFSVALEKSPNKGGWTYAVMSNFVEHFGSGAAVKVKAAVDGYPFQSSFMPMGGGKYMLPIRADIRAVIKKKAGDTVTIHILERA